MRKMERMKSNIAIIDYNMGNLASVKNAFLKVGAEVDIVEDAKALSHYDKLILPGVGAFGDAMEHLQQNALDEAIKEEAQKGKAILGICLGMQLLFEQSYEFGKSKGLGLIEGEVVPFEKAKFAHKLKVPHMGWNEMFIQKENPLTHSLHEPYLYFVHSFHAVCDDKYAIGKSFYGYEFISAVQNQNIYGFQPHPEKSHQNGLKIIENFIKL